MLRIILLFPRQEALRAGFAAFVRACSPDWHFRRLDATATNEAAQVQFYFRTKADLDRCVGLPISAIIPVYDLDFDDRWRALIRSPLPVKDLPAPSP